jgi:hypothetical protein
MRPFKWRLRDQAGNDLRDSETFDSKEDAEAWMGAEWSELAGEGADRVVLLQGEDVVYDMSLQPE